MGVQCCRSYDTQPIVPFKTLVPNTQSDPEVKIAIVGAATVGKTTMVENFISGIFSKKYSPTVMDYYKSSTYIDHKKVFCEFFDTSGDIMMS